MKPDVLACILENLSDGFYAMDSNLCLTYINKKALAFLAKHKTEVIGKSFSEVFPTTMVKDLRQMYKQAVQADKEAEFEYYYEPLASWFELRMFPNAGNLYVFFYDITKLKIKNLELQKARDELQTYKNQLEELVKERTCELEAANNSLKAENLQRQQIEMALRASEKRFAMAFSASPIMMGIHDKDGRFIDVNNKFLNNTGWSKYEVIGRTIGDLKLCYECAPAVLEKTIAERAGISNLETYYLTKRGERREVLLSNEVVNFNGRDLILLLMNDITEQRAFEKELSKLESLNLVGQMAASVAHEIRNPMTAARGFLQLLGKRLTNERDHGYIEIVIEELDRINHIITQFLSLARNRTIQTACINLNDVINSLYPIIQADAMMNNKEIKLDLAGDIPRLTLDEREIRQLILNLVRNGLEAMESGGKLTIQTYLDNQDVILAIQDEGSGIDAAVLDKLGTPFITTKPQGTGLGLSVCYSIVERHHGRITVDSSLKGTTFYVMLPNKNCC
ncbi:MAG: ATP-binding protein [Negativicutes bacterium]|jgi:two-component system, sporulation sensor kinase E